MLVSLEAYHLHILMSILNVYILLLLDLFFHTQTESLDKSDSSRRKFPVGFKHLVVAEVTEESRDEVRGFKFEI